MENTSKKRTLSDNKIIILLSFFTSGFITFFQSILLFFASLGKKNVKPIPENKFLDVLHFLFFLWPKHFWKKPSGIALGRSLSTFIHYFFYKDSSFEKKEILHTKKPRS